MRQVSGGKTAPRVPITWTSIDTFLLLLVAIWGANFSVVKVVIAEIPPFAFNALRLVVATLVLLSVAWYQNVSLPFRSAWRPMAGLGLGLCVYQLSFVSGLVYTSATNSAVILGCMPVVVLIFNAISRNGDYVTRWQGVGVALAVVGVCLVVGIGSIGNRDVLRGDLLTIVSLFCWAWYTVGSRPLLLQYSPLQVTTCAMGFCTVFFVPAGALALPTLDVSSVTGMAWIATFLSGFLALAVSHIIWYTGVQRLGSARTSVFSNLVPVAAMFVAAVWLQESIGWVKTLGAAIVISGLLLSRLGGSISRRTVGRRNVLKPL